MEVSARTNAAASTLVLDVIGPDTDLESDARATWENARDDHIPANYFDQMPEGPDDGDTPVTAIEQMRALLTQLLAEAPVRGAKSADSADVEEEDQSSV